VLITTAQGRSPISRRISLIHAPHRAAIFPQEAGIRLARSRTHSTEEAGPSVRAASSCEVWLREREAICLIAGSSAIIPARLFPFLPDPFAPIHLWSLLAVLAIINGAIHERSPPSQRWHRYYFMRYLFTRDAIAPIEARHGFMKCAAKEDLEAGSSVSSMGYPNAVS
jgi:hypothetical protein